MQTDRLREIVERNKLDNLVDEMDSAEKDISLKVGFLGEFNSGKSSLINKLLDQKILPVMDEPTSKTIVEIEGADVEKTEYYKYVGTNKEAISALEFSDICTTAGEYVAYLRLPVGRFLKKDFLLIDTPGISSLDQSDEDITFGYLPSLDASILCQDIHFGALNDSILNFLLKPEVRVLINNFIFAITKTDTKSDIKSEIVRANIVSQLQELNKTHDLNMTNIEKKIVLVSSQQEINEFARVFDELIIGKKQKLQEERREKEYKKIAKKALSLLKDQKKSATLDLDDIRGEEKEAESDITALKKGLKSLDEKFDRFEEKLQDDIRSILTTRLPEFTKVQDEDELQNQISLIEQSIVERANDRASRYIGDAGLHTIDGAALAGLKKQVGTILRNTNYTKQIGSFILFAVVIPGATLAANTAEGAGGMVVREAAKKGAKSVAAEAGKKIAKETVKKAIMVSVLKNVLDIVNKINPVEIVGNLIQGGIIESNLRGNLNPISSNLSFAIRNDLEERLETLFDESKEKIQDKRNLLGTLYSKKEERGDQFSEYMNHIGEDIRELIILEAT